MIESQKQELLDLEEDESRSQILNKKKGAV